MTNRIVIFVVLLSLAVQAHTFWLRPQANGCSLHLGHDAASESYDRASLSELQAYDVQGGLLTLQESFEPGRLQLLAPQAQAFSLKADYGTWIKTIHGWRPGSKRDSQDRVLKSIWSVHYCKLVRLPACSLKLGLPLELVVSQPQGGQMQGQVLWQGRPQADCSLYHEHEHLGKTDQEGRFQLNVPAGPYYNLSCEVEESLENHPDAERKTTVGALTVVL
ncbi:MAG: DUF4198 domain-containing protein [Vulcanimicrobiota bacterium]